MNDQPLSDPQDADPPQDADLLDEEAGDSGPSPAQLLPRPRDWRRWLLMLLVACAWCGLDQLTKHWAHTTLREQHQGRVDIVEGYVAISYVRNPGAAWGFLSRSPASFRRPFFLAVSIIAIAFILYLFVQLEPSQRLLMTALAMVMGGALGNLVDRLRYDYVIDFIELSVRRSFKWPTFNVADVAISCGVALLFVDMVVTGIRQRRQRRLLAARELHEQLLERVSSGDDEAGS